MNDVVTEITSFFKKKTKKNISVTKLIPVNRGISYSLSARGGAFNKVLYEKALP